MSRGLARLKKIYWGEISTGGMNRFFRISPNSMGDDENPDKRCSMRGRVQDEDGRLLAESRSSYS